MGNMLESIHKNGRVNPGGGGPGRLSVGANSADRGPERGSLGIDEEVYSSEITTGLWRDYGAAHYKFVRFQRLLPRASSITLPSLGKLSGATISTKPLSLQTF